MNLNNYIEFMNYFLISVLSGCDLRLPYYTDMLKLMRSEVLLMFDNLRNNHYIDLLRSLKVVIEASIQLFYYFSKYGINEEGILREVKRRERSATTFNIKMVSKIRDLHLNIRKEIIKTYLAICEFTHPTRNLLLIHKRKSKKILHDFLRRSADIMTYCLLRVCGANLVNDDLLRMINRLGLERSMRYIGKSKR